MDTTLSLSPFSHHPSLQFQSRATTFKVQADARSAAGWADPATFPLYRPGPCPACLALRKPRRRTQPRKSPPGVPCRAHPSSWPELGRARTPLPSSSPPRRVPLTVVPGRPPGSRQHVGGLQGVIGGGRHPAALEAVAFDLLYQEGAGHGATGVGLGGGTCEGPWSGGGGQPGAIGCLRGVSALDSSQRATGGRQRGAGTGGGGPGCSSGSRSGLAAAAVAAAALRQAIAGAVLSTPAAGFIWDAGWRRSGGPLAMELFSALIHQMSPRTIAPHTFP